MKRNKIIILVVINILFFNCKSNKDSAKDTKEIMVLKKNISKEIFSPDKSKILILEYVDKMELPIIFTYKVLNSKSKKELISGSFSGIKMEWDTNKTIKAYSYTFLTEMDNKKPRKPYKIIEIK